MAASAIALSGQRDHLADRLLLGLVGDELTKPRFARNAAKTSTTSAMMAKRPFAVPRMPRKVNVRQSIFASLLRVALTKKLARYPVNGRKRSLRDIAAELEAAGHVTSAGTRYGAAAVARMIAG